MAKVTKAQEAATGASDSYTEAELSDPTPLWPKRAMLGELKEGDLSSLQGDGTASTQFSGSEQTSSENQNPSPPRPVPTTGNPSYKKDEEPDSSAHSTDGSGQKEETRPSGRKAAPAKKSTTKKETSARTTNLDREFEFDDDYDEFV